MTPHSAMALEHLVLSYVKTNFSMVLALLSYEPSSNLSSSLPSLVSVELEELPEINGSAV